MHFSKSFPFRGFALILMIATGLPGCIDLPPLREETFTFMPNNTASIFGDKQIETFGVCGPTLDRRGTRLYLWDEFVRQRNSTSPDYAVEHLAGYEISVSRGESCHLRVLDTYQAAVSFDLSRLPSSAVTSAELRISRYFSPLDSPRLRGSTAQCTVMMIGEATEPWASGIFAPIGTADGMRPFITWRPARIDAGPHDARGTSTLRLNITNTVSEWVRGVRPNNGIVITPDLESVMDIYRRTDEGGLICDMGITGFELVVTVAVPDR